MKVARKKRRSLVRFLASCVPDFLWEYFLPVASRKFMSVNVFNGNYAIKQNIFQMDDSNSSFCSFKSYFHNDKKKLQLLNSTPKRDEIHENAKIKELQRELEEIKKQVAKLMEHQTEHFQCSDYGTLSNPEQSQKSFAPPPPPPPPPPLPPPPPPLPSFPLTVPDSPLKIDRKKTNVVPPARNGFPCGKELLKDLKKVQLRKVEKSPGGGPLKKPKRVNDPGDFLEAVLRKRFGRIQNSPESSLESASSDTNNSFSSLTHNSTHEIQKNIKYTVT